MLSPAYLNTCTAAILALYDELNEAIIRDIVERLCALNFEASATAAWEMEKLIAVGRLTYEDALAEIAKRTGQSEAALKKAFEDAGTESMHYDNAIYRKAGLSPLPLSQSAAMLQVLTAGYKKCQGDLHNLTLTTANMAQSTMIEACNAAYMQVSSGAFSMNTAIKQAIGRIGQSGTWVLYPTGHRDRVDVAVTRAVRTGVAQTCGQLQIQQLNNMMWDVVDTTAHMDARETHSVWQGGRFSYQGRNPNYPDFEASTGYGSVDGLMGINCRHGFYPAIDGSPRMYTDKQLAEWRGRTVRYNGTDYTGYEATQQQRAKERAIRSTKRELAALDEGIKAVKNEALKRELSAEFAAKSQKLAKQQAALTDFLEQTGMKRDFSRTQVNEFGRSMSGKVKTARKGLQIQKKSGIINIRGEGMYRKSRKDNIVPMPKQQLFRIEKAFKRTGGVILRNEETDAYLAKRNAEGITIDAKTILLKQKPGRASVFEELIHSAQYRMGKNDGSPISRLKCEIEAQEKLLTYSKQYCLTDIEIAQTKDALACYKKELLAYIKK